MKLCTICDKKIEGTWCKNCRKFVKTYEISSGIYLNERHDPMNDKGCTYHTDSHTDSTKNVVRERTSTSTGNQRAYTSTTTTTSTSASGTNRSATKKKGKKTALIIIIGYILVNSLGVIGPAVVKVIDRFSEGYQEEVIEDDFYEDETELSEEELAELFDKELRNAALLELTPEYHAEEEDYEVLYFSPEDIEEIGYSCDNRHFDMSLEEFESWLLANSTDGFQYSDDISKYGNYYYISSDYSQVSFNCYRDYYSSSEYQIRADYDTATKLLHVVRFATAEDTLDLDLCLSLVKAFEPDAEWTKEQFVKVVEDARAVGDYTTLYYSEEVHVAFEMNEEGYALVYYPVYK